MFRVVAVEGMSSTTQGRVILVFDVQQWNSQLRRGLVELCVLAALHRDEAYGYQLVERLRTAQGLELTESTVYPVLTRLAAEQLLAVRTAPSPSGPPRRYYRLTDAGQRRLIQMRRHWDCVSQSIQRLLAGES